MVSLVELQVRVRPFVFRWGPLTPWVACALITVWQLRQPGLTPDSEAYIDTARNIARGYGASTFHLNLLSTMVPDPRLLWPPAFPALLAPGILLSLSFSTVAAIINVLMLLSISCILFRTAARASSVIAGALAVFLWLTLALRSMDFRFIWSEPLFLCLTLLELTCISFAYQAGKWRYPLVILAGVMAGLATLTRTVGLVYVVAGFMGIGYLGVWSGRRHTWPGLLTSAGLFGTSVLIVALPYYLFNLVNFGDLFGGYARPQLADGPLISIAIRGASATARLLFQIGRFVLLFLVGSALVGLLWPAKSLRNGAFICRAQPLIPILLMSMVLYVVALNALNVFVMSEELDTRTLSPIYPELALITGVLVGTILPESKLTGSWASVIGLAATVLSIYTAGLPGGIIRESPVQAEMGGWLERNTDSHDLIVGNGVIWASFYHGSTVLDDFYEETPRLTPERVHEFLQGTGRQFRRAFVVSAPDAFDQLSHDYALEGYTLTPVFQSSAPVIAQLEPS